MNAAVIAQRIAICALIDALPIHDKVAAHARLLEMISQRDGIPGVIPGTTQATDVRAALETIVDDLRRSALASLAH